MIFSRAYFLALLLATMAFHAQERPAKRSMSAMDRPEPPRKRIKLNEHYQNTFENMLLSNDVLGIEDLLVEGHEIDLNKIMRKEDIGCKKNHTPLMVAVIKNMPEMVRILLAAGADPNKKTNCECATAAHLCIRIKKKGQILDDLLAWDAHILEINHECRPLLHTIFNNSVGADRAYVHFVRKILDHAHKTGQLSQILNQTDSEGDTPLHAALTNESHDGIFQLLERGASIYTPDYEGKTVAYINQVRDAELQDQTINSVIEVYDWVETGKLPERNLL